ncbi:MAG: hypothetical protein A2X31_03925 [Elusimicrobia bacterium GWB2_63_22]|nr:MAG: hypothetical protein A2X31_03925 [Elusimicrobia bacterium GWB2_63_22]
MLPEIIKLPPEYAYADLPVDPVGVVQDLQDHMTGDRTRDAQAQAGGELLPGLQGRDQLCPLRKDPLAVVEGYPALGGQLYAFAAAREKLFAKDKLQLFKLKA